MENPFGSGDLIVATINLKPWKGKCSKLVFVTTIQRDLIEHTKEILEHNKIKHKRRTAQSVSITYPLNIKIL